MNPNEKPWSAEEVELLASGLSNAEISARTGRSQPAIRGKRQRLAKKAAEFEALPELTKLAIKQGEKLAEKVAVHLADAASNPFSKILAHGEFPTGMGETVRPVLSYEEDQARARADFWKREHDVVKRKYERALKEQSALEQLVASVKELAPRSYSPLPPVHRVSAGKGKPQSAVLFLSDTHVGQVIDSAQTLGFGGYDFEMFLARLKFYEEAVTSILRDHTTTALTELVVVMGGDMLHGALNHAAEVAQHHTLFSQWYGAGHAFAQFLRNLAPLVPQVRIVCTVGNHTRWGHQHKMPTDQRFSNLDSFCYAYTEALTREIPNLLWSLDTQPFTLFEVQGFLFHLSHGDQLKGGDRALGIPNHAVGRLVSASNQLFGKEGKPSPHYYMVGHLHRSIVLPHAKGSFIVNGGFPGIDGFGLASGFSPVDPKQVFFLVHPRYGKTACYDIELKFAQVGVRPYTIPGGFI